MAEGRGQPSPWEFLRNQVYLGSNAFVESVQCGIEEDRDLSEVPASQRRAPAKAIAAYCGRGVNRDEGIRRAYGSGSYSLKEIGDFFGLHYSRVSRIVAEAKNKT